SPGPAPTRIGGPLTRLVRGLMRTTMPGPSLAAVTQTRPWATVIAMGVGGRRMKDVTRLVRGAMRETPGRQPLLVAQTAPAPVAIPLGGLPPLPGVGMVATVLAVAGSMR